MSNQTDPRLSRLAEAFAQLYPHNPFKHGKMTGDPVDGKKPSISVNSPVTQLLVEKHLTNAYNKDRLGYLAGNEETTNVGCIDIDFKNYDYNEASLEEAANKLTAVFEANKLSSYYYEKSTSGGYHFWLWVETPVHYIVMRDALRMITHLAEMETLEVYPMGDDAKGRWVYMPYAGAIIDPKGLGRTWLCYPDGTPIKIDDLGDAICTNDTEVFEELARKFDGVKKEREKNFEASIDADLDGINIHLLEDVIKNPPVEIKSRHDALAAFLNLGKRMKKLEETANILKKEEVHSRWIVDKSRTLTEWVDEIDRWVEKVSAGTISDHTYGFKYLIDTGWQMGSFARVPIDDPVRDKEDGGKKTKVRENGIDSLKPTAIALIYAKILEEQGKLYKYHPNREITYQYIDGVYVEVGLGQIRRDLSAWYTNEKRGQPSEQRLREIITKMQMDHWILPDKYEQPQQYINCRNGLYNWQTREFTQHTDKIILFNQCPVQYRPELAGKRGVWHEFLESSLPDSKNGLLYRTVLQEFLGYSMTPDTRLQKFLNLYGLAGTGKSTIGDVINRVFDYRQSFSIAGGGMDYLAMANASSLAALVNKNFVFVGESTTRGRDVDAATRNLKSIVGCDTLQVNQKFKPAYPYQFPTKIIIASNNYLRLGEDALNDSIFRRMILIPFETVPDERRQISAEILTNQDEMDIVFMWLIEGLNRLIDNDWKLSSDLRQTQTEMRELANPMIEFLRTNAAPMQNHKTYSGKVIGNYNQWAEFNGYPPINNRNAKDRIRNALEALGWPIKHDTDRVGAYWEGLQVRDFIEFE